MQLTVSCALPQVLVTVEKRSSSYSVHIAVHDAGDRDDGERSIVWCVSSLAACCTPACFPCHGRVSRMTHASAVHGTNSLPHPHRGTYRVSPAKWFAPEAIKPPAGSTKQASTGRVSSKLARTAPGVHEATIEVPSQLAPLSLAFQLVSGEQQQKGPQQQRPELNSLNQTFAVPVGMAAGRVQPMGAHQRTLM